MLDAIWTSYPALVEHAKEASCKSSAHQAICSNADNIESPQFVHSLAVLQDALKKVGILSKALQSQDCTLTKAYVLVNRVVWALKNQKEGQGDCFKLCETSLFEENEFMGVSLESSRNAYLNTEQFLQALIDNMVSRLESTVASGSRHDSDKQKLKQ